MVNTRKYKEALTELTQKKRIPNEFQCIKVNTKEGVHICTDVSVRVTALTAEGWMRQWGVDGNTWI